MSIYRHKHMNHSKEFYAEIDRVFPDYKRCNKFVNRKAVKKQAVRVVLGLSSMKDNGGVYMKRASCYNEKNQEVR